jgi:catechol 2,3-dioxygenase-like lactoylglutathione lyase family enzyme
MPRGLEDAARAFYCGVLGMTETPKPDDMAARGGCWFASGNVAIHLGVEDDFRPAKKAHPALLCNDLDALISAFLRASIGVVENADIPGVRRCFVHDPFGNRIELIAS